MSSRLVKGFLVLGLIVSLGGCTDTSTKSIYDEDAMAKYRSTPEQIEAGMKAAQAAATPNKKQMQDMGKSAKELATAKPQ